MYGIPNEDEYWENVRERMEAPSRFYEPEPVLETVYLDEEIDELEAEYGCPMDELTEGDLQDIVERLTGILPDSASYDSAYIGINYRYMEAV